MMVAAVSTTPNPKTSSREGSHQNRTRPPLIPSEVDNGVALRRPKGREVTSRYLSSSSSTSTSSSSSSSSSSRRCASPLVFRTAHSTAVMTPMPAPSSLIKRSHSVERRRPVTPRSNTFHLRPGNAGEVTTASKMLITSARSLSVSFQGESFSLQVSKTKPTPTPTSVRKGTPERRKPTPTRADQTENSKPVDQHRWPGRSRQANSLTRSMDFTGDRKKLGGSGIVARSLQQSMIDERNQTLFDGRLNLDSGNAELEKANELATANSVVGSTVTSDLIASDTESVSSGSTSGAQECGGGGGGTQGRGGPRGIMVPARFWQETSNRLRRAPEPSSPLSKSIGLRTPVVPSKLIAPKKLVTDSPTSSPRGIPPSRGQSPLRGPVRPASPSKLVTTSTSSPLRGMPSPTRVRGAVVSSLNGNLSNHPSILSFSADVRRGKMGENRIVDAHLLRLLHNRYLQWRFINARADASLLAQSMNAEKSLYNAWVATVDLRDSVRDKRRMLQLMRQKLKLTSILKGQITYLDEWGPMDRDHSNSLSGAIEALKASTLRLPVVSGARADIQNLKDAICSAVDVMQAMASSICSLLSKRFGSQERENSMKRISCLAPVSFTREESQIPLARPSTSLAGKWGSASAPDHRCQIGEDVEHRIGMIETSLTKFGMILDSIQGDVMQVNKGMKEFLMEMEGLRKKLVVHDSSQLLMNKGHEDIKASLDAALKSISDQTSIDLYQEKLQQNFAMISAVPEKIEACLLNLQSELCKTITKEMEARMTL